MLGGASLAFQGPGPLPEHHSRRVEELALRTYGPSDALQFRHPNDLNMSQSSSSYFKGTWEAAGGYWERSRRVCSFDHRDFQMRVCALLPVGVYPDYPMEYYRLSSSTGRAKA